MLNRRSFLRAAGAGAFGLSLGGHAWAAGAQARRLILFYFPDGVPGPSQDGAASLWHASSGGGGVELPEVLSPLAPFREDCVFFRGLTLGPTDSGSHPGGAQKLLTAVDHGNGRSIDQELAATVGAGSPHRLIYLGAQATVNNASGDKHISYPAGGASTPPEDDPRRAFARLFGGEVEIPGGVQPPPRFRRSVLDSVRADLESLRGRVGGSERARLELHMEALREVEQRVRQLEEPREVVGCDVAPGSLGGVPDALQAPEAFPAVLRAQMDVMVQGMACGLSRVGVIQASHHTSELIMSRFAGTALQQRDDMRSHQASHYGAAHDFQSREFSAFFEQRRWFAEQYAYLLGELAARPEGEGTMLDHSLVLFCTEVCDGNTHLHDDIPMILAGRGGGCVRTGRLAEHWGRRNGDLFASLAQAMGHRIDRFGQDSQGPLPGLVL